MRIFGIHIMVISDTELERRTEDVRQEAKQEQRELDSACRKRLLYNAEIYRKIAESALRRPVRFEADIRPRLTEQMTKNRSKQEAKA